MIYSFNYNFQKIVVLKAGKKWPKATMPTLDYHFPQTSPEYECR